MEYVSSNGPQRSLASPVAPCMMDGPPTVFIVSADGEMRSHLQGFLTAYGVRVVSCEAAADFLGCLPPQGPVCLILDLVLRDMRGFDLQLQLADRCPAIVFATRHSDIACSVRAIKAGALDFLTPPFEPEVLLRAVHAALDIDANNRTKRERVNGMRERLEKLTPREQQVLPMVVGGWVNKQVAAALGISEITVQIHRRRVMQKMRAASFADLVRSADSLGIVPVARMRASPAGASSSHSYVSNLLERVAVE